MVNTHWVIKWMRNFSLWFNKTGVIFRPCLPKGKHPDKKTKMGSKQASKRFTRLKPDRRGRQPGKGLSALCMYIWDWSSYGYRPIYPANFLPPSAAMVLGRKIPGAQNLWNVAKQEGPWAWDLSWKDIGQEFWIASIGLLSIHANPLLHELCIFSSYTLGLIFVSLPRLIFLPPEN